MCMLCYRKGFYWVDHILLSLAPSVTHRNKGRRKRNRLLVSHLPVTSISQVIIEIASRIYASKYNPLMDT